MDIEELPALGCQGSTQTTPDYPDGFVDLAKSPSEVVLDPGTEGKEGIALLRFEKYDFIKLITQHLLQQQESSEFIGESSKPIRCLLCVARTWLYNTENATALHKAVL